MKNTALKPICFEKSNKNLLKPNAMTDRECGGLWVYTNNIECISCWKLTIIQRLYLLIHGKIWLSVLSGTTQPPVWLNCAKNVFNEYNIK